MDATSHAAPSGWTEIERLAESSRLFRHDTHDIWVHIAHDADHFEQDEETHAHEDNTEDKTQVLRWRAWVTLGKYTTCGINTHSICRDSCDAAKKKTLDWAIDWMRGDFEGINDAAEYRIEDESQTQE